MEKMSLKIHWRLAVPNYYYHGHHYHYRYLITHTFLLRLIP